MIKKEIKILVVDDVSTIREFIKYYFEDIGYTVLSAGTAEEALPIIKEKNPEILILDMHLPGMNGLELLRQVRQFNATVKVIMVSGSNIDFKSDTRFKNLNILEFVQKPMGFNELLSAVNMAAKLLKNPENI